MKLEPLCNDVYAVYVFDPDTQDWHYFGTFSTRGAKYDAQLQGRLTRR